MNVLWLKFSQSSIAVSFHFIFNGKLLVNKKVTNLDMRAPCENRGILFNIRQL